MSPTLLRREPVQSQIVPSSSDASWMPYFAGPKNGFVVA
jgi:hypothetical protein